MSYYGVQLVARLLLMMLGVAMIGEVIVVFISLFDIGWTGIKNRLLEGIEDSE